MTFDPHSAYYSDFDVDVEAKIEGLRTKIEEEVQDVVNRFNDSVLDSGWGWLSPGPKLLYEHARDNLEDEIERLWDEFTKKVDEIWDEVEKFTGNPATLMDMNASYLDAAARIRDEKTVIGRLSTEVSKYWDGVAWRAYTNVSGEQRAAVAGVDAGLVKAGTACAEGAQQLTLIWNDVIAALLGVVDEVLDAIKDGTDAGQWITLDAGPAIKVIGKLVVDVVDLGNTLSTYFFENATVKKSMWRDLNNGLDGLDANNEWPGMSPQDGRDLHDQGTWDMR